MSLLDIFLATVTVVLGLLAAPVLAALFLVAVGYGVFVLVDLIDRVTRLR